jgi:hypothetical protein
LARTVGLEAAGIALVLGWYLYVPGPPATLALGTESAELRPTETARLNTTVTDGRGHILTPQLSWTAEAGAVSSDGVYTAPTRAGTYAIHASVNGLDARVDIHVVAGAPASITVAPASVTLDPTASQAVSTSVADAWGNARASDGLKWTSSPAWIATAKDGVFTAGPSSGSGALIARLGDVSQAVPVRVSCPVNPTIGGLPFTVTCTSSADLYVEAPSASIASALQQQVDADVAQIQADIGRAFGQKPRVYVATNTSSYGQILQSAFGRSVSTAAEVATHTEGVYLTPEQAILVNWQEAGSVMPQSTLRHELTHALIGQLVDRRADTRVPKWFHEGVAFLEQRTLPGGDWIGLEARYTAVSMATVSLLPSIETMTTAWYSAANAKGAWYYPAAEAAALLREDVGGWPGIVRLLDVVNVGRSFSDAYQDISGQTFESFGLNFPSRLAAIAESPGVVAVNDTPQGEGLSYIYFGYPPGSHVTVNVVGARSYSFTTKQSSEFGTHFGYFGVATPRGAYTITVSGPGGRAVTTITH